IEPFAWKVEDKPLARGIDRYARPGRTGAVEASDARDIDAVTGKFVDDELSDEVFSHPPDQAGRALQPCNRNACRCRGSAAGFREMPCVELGGPLRQGGNAENTIPNGHPQASHRRHLSLRILQVERSGRTPERKGLSRRAMPAEAARHSARRTPPA